MGFCVQTTLGKFLLTKLKHDIMGTIFLWYFNHYYAGQLKDYSYQIHPKIKWSLIIMSFLYYARSCNFHKSMLKCSAGYELGWLCYQILWSPLGFPLESEGMITYRPRKVLLSHLKGEWMVSEWWAHWANGEHTLNRIWWMVSECRAQAECKANAWWTDTVRERKNAAR